MYTIAPLKWKNNASHGRKTEASVGFGTYQIVHSQEREIGSPIKFTLRYLFTEHFDEGDLLTIEVPCYNRHNESVALRELRALAESDWKKRLLKAKILKRVKMPVFKSFV